QQRPLPCKRRPQLVGDGGHQLTSLLVGRGQVTHHHVERPTELPHLVGRGGGDLRGVVTPRHTPCCTGHLPQRRGHAARQPLGHAECRDDGDRKREPR